MAEKIVSGDAAPSKCTVSSPAGIDMIAEYLGVDPGAQEKRVARLHCAGGVGRAAQIAKYEGFDSCRGAHIVGGGGKECTWGCLGLSDCEVACTFDAIRMNELKLPQVDVDKCTACGTCKDSCPAEAIKEGDPIFVIDPDTCIDCGSCVDECPVGAIVEA